MQLCFAIYCWSLPAQTPWICLLTCRLVSPRDTDFCFRCRWLEKHNGYSFIALAHPFSNLANPFQQIFSDRLYSFVSQILSYPALSSWVFSHVWINKPLAYIVYIYMFSFLKLSLTILKKIYLLCGFLCFENNNNNNNTQPRSRDMFFSVHLLRTWSWDNASQIALSNAQKNERKERTEYIGFKKKPTQLVEHQKHTDNYITNPESHVSEFKTFLCMGRCRNHLSLKSLFWYAP